MLTITLLGTAATMPLPERALTAAVAECGGHSLLLDCGEGTQTAARRAGVNLMRADAICLTHYHGDHIFGLPGLLQTLGAQGRTRPLVLLGPEGLLEVWRAVYALTGPLPYAVKPLVCRAGQPVALDALSDGWPAGATLLPVATKHRVRSLGYRLDLPRAGRFDPEKARALGVPVTQWRLLQRGQAVPLAERMVQPAEVLGAPRKGLRFVFSGDSAPCPALEQAAQGADLLLLKNVCPGALPPQNPDFSVLPATYGAHKYIQNLPHIFYTFLPVFPSDGYFSAKQTLCHADFPCSIPSFYHLYSHNVLNFSGNFTMEVL